MLFNTEPESAYPPNSSWFSRRFSDVQIHFGRLDGTVFPLRYPINMKRTHSNTLGRSNQACFLASNRFSPFPDSNYQLRRQIVDEIDPGLLAVAGGLWKLTRRAKFLVVVKHVLVSVLSGSPISMAKCVSYVRDPALNVSAVDDKFNFLEGYPVALVIENENTYVSEKLIEALQAGCVPVYVGPEIPQDWVPQDLYIRAQRDIQSIQSALRFALACDLEIAQQLQEDWLRSENALVWSREVVYKMAHEKVEKA